MTADDSLERLLLKQAVEADKAQLSMAMSRLSGAVKQRTDIASKVRANPYPWLAGGLVLGLILGLRRGRS